MIIFGRCPNCGLKFGRKTTFCPRCMDDTVLSCERTGDTQEEETHYDGSSGGSTRKNIFLFRIALVLAIGIIIWILLRAQNLGLPLIF